MKLHHPIIHSLGGKKHLHTMEIEVEEVHSSKAPVALVVQEDGNPKRHVFRIIDGRLYSPVPNQDGGTWNSNGLALFSTPEKAVSTDRLKGYSPSWSKRVYSKSPFFSFSERSAVTGATGDVRRDRPQPREVLAATPMGRIVETIASHSCVVDGIVHRETVGPILRSVWYADKLEIVDGHHRESDSVAFSIDDMEGAERFAADNGLAMPELLIERRCQLPHYDPKARCFEAAAWQAFKELDGLRINEMDRNAVLLFKGIRDALAKSWMDRPALENGLLAWPYHAFDRESRAGMDLEPYLRQFISMSKTRRTRTIIDLALSRPPTTREESPADLEDFTL